MIVTLRDGSEVEVRNFIVGPHAKAGGQHNNGPASVWFRINGGEWVESVARTVVQLVQWLDVCYTSSELLECKWLVDDSMEVI